jgi:hypothetical protein
LSDELQTALALHQRGQLADAVRIARRILSSRPTAAQALHHLGVLKCQQTKFEEGTKLIRAALTIDRQSTGNAMAKGTYLVVATPCYGGQVTVKYLTAALALQRSADQRGIRIDFLCLSSSALITHARNRLVAIFLDQPSATHLLFIDADQGYEPDQVFRLLGFDADVCAAVSPKKIFNWDKITRAVKEGRDPRTAGLDYVVNFVRQGTTIETKAGFARATAAGTGFMMIKRGAIEKLCIAYPELRGWIELSDRESGGYFGLFDCLRDPETGASLSEDLSFCKRWIDVGGEIWVDTESKLSHTGPVTFDGNLSSQFRAT